MNIPNKNRLQQPFETARIAKDNKNSIFATVKNLLQLVTLLTMKLHYSACKAIAICFKIENMRLTV